MPPLYTPEITTTPVDSVYCFPDTNTFLHFQTFDEVDWTEKFAATQVYLVLAPMVMRELDQFKDDHTNEKRWNRVRMLLSKLKSLLASADESDVHLIRPHIFLIDLPNEPMVNWSRLHLDPNIADDRLIATILEFAAAHPDGQTVLLTHDFPAQQKAKGRQIRYLDPENLINKIEQPAPQTAKIKELEKKLQAYENRMPKLSLAFREGEVSVDKVPRTFHDKGVVWHSNDVLEKVLDERQERLEAIITARPKNVSDREIKAFRTDWTNYIRFLKDGWMKQRALAAGQRFQFAFVVAHEGSAPGTDIEIELHFPAESFLIGLAHEDDYFWGFGHTKVPPEPQPDWTTLTGFLGSAFHVTSPPPTSLPETGPRRPLYTPNHRDIVTYKHPKLRPTDVWHLKPIAAFIPPRYTRGFEIHCTIHADELMQPMSKTLVVTLDEVPNLTDGETG